MSWFFNANDWFGRRPHVCLVCILLLLCLAGAL